MTYAIGYQIETIMSILQDLDPQYAKIHSQPTAARRYAKILIGLLVTMGCGYWVLTQLSIQPQSADAHNSISASAPANKAEKQAWVKNESGSIDQANTTNDANAIPSPKLAAATIRDDGHQPLRVGEATSQPPRVSLSENAKSSLADTEYRRQSPTSGNHGKVVHTSSAKKGERNPTAARPVAKTEKNQLHTGKRPAERDVDIISAIVR